MKKNPWGKCHIDGLSCEDWSHSHYKVVQSQVVSLLNQLDSCPTDSLQHCKDLSVGPFGFASESVGQLLNRLAREIDAP
jgi:hypothetical protein